MCIQGSYEVEREGSEYLNGKKILDTKNLYNKVVTKERGVSRGIFRYCVIK
jgi:hypothetical protein